MKKESFALKGEAYFFLVTEIGKIIGFRVSFVRKLKNQFMWNKQQKEVSFHYAASVTVKYVFSVLPQFEQTSLPACWTCYMWIACE